MPSIFRHGAITALVSSLALYAAPGPAEAQHDAGQRLFAALAGTWSGSGTVSVIGGSAERLRCRAAYRPSDAAHIGLELRCASDSFKMEVESDLSRDGNRVGGTWQETTFGVGGTIDGTIRGERIDALVKGPGTSGRLLVNLRGNTQSVTLTSQSQLLSGTASVTMRRE